MDAISLRGVRAYGRHGANPGERDRRQLIEIDLTAQIDLRDVEASDDLSQTIDYAALHERLVRVVAMTSYALLERLAADLLDAVFFDRRVVCAEVTLSKPGILDGATPAVTLARANPHAISS
ncbi:MAG: dihydroneopterin aldolase [Candidatus Eremiobacteraeota bacterium]|nr:dihydroneopterin aldolase [Candidatus Eremiobacteraeota bacterium]